MGVMSAPIPDWEPLGEAILSDQLGAYDRHREQAPLARSPRGVTLFRHADVVAAAGDPVTFSSRINERRQVPNTLDPPEHAAYRAAIDPFFSDGRMAALEPRLRAVAAELLTHAPETTEAVRDFGYPFAVRTMADWLGWTGAEQRLLTWMADNHAATRSADRTRLIHVAADFDAIVAEQVQRRHALGDDAPDDPTTELTRTAVAGRPLTDPEIVSILRNWTAGDLASIAACIGVVVHQLATHPDRQDALRTDPSRLAQAIDEMLRIDNPFLVNRRVTTCPTRIAGSEIVQGTRIYLNWAAANRDPRVFGDPDAYRPSENAQHNIVYGSGVHVCPGRPLATVELVTAIGELLAATTAFSLDESRPAQRETYPLGGWRTVFIRVNR